MEKLDGMQDWQNTEYMEVKDAIMDWMIESEEESLV